MAESKINGFKETEVGLVPADWEVVKLGDIFEETSLRVKDIGKTNIPVLSITRHDGLILQEKKFKKRVASRDIKNYKVVHYGEMVYGFPMEEGVIHFLWRFKIGAVSPTYYTWKKKTNKADSRFLDYYLKTPRMIRTYSMFTTKTVHRRKIVSPQDFKQILIPLPPLPEQQKIIKVLDTIQRAIEIQDRIIETTKKLKKSLMQKLFTEGTKGEELKETEIGLIPKSWEVVRLGDLAEIKYGKAKPKDSGNIPVVGSGGIYAFTNRALIDTPTIVIGRKGTAGKCWLIKEPSYPSDTTFYLCWKTKKIEVEFVYNYMQLNPLSGEHAKTTLPSLQKYDLEKYRLPHPSLLEQREIVNILSTIDRKIEIEQKRKNLLKQLFKTMVHKLMSGEIRLGSMEI